MCAKTGSIYTDPTQAGRVGSLTDATILYRLYMNYFLSDDPRFDHKLSRLSPLERRASDVTSLGAAVHIQPVDYPVSAIRCKREAEAGRNRLCAQMMCGTQYYQGLSHRFADHAKFRNPLSVAYTSVEGTAL